MPENTPRGFRELISKKNKDRLTDISHEEITSEVRAMLSNDPTAWPDLTVGIIQKLTLQFYKNAPHYRTMSQTSSYWAQTKLGQKFNTYGISSATEDAKEIFNYCLSMLDHSAHDKFELAEPQFASLRDWQKQQLALHTEYAEMTDIVKEWNRKSADADLNSLEENMGLNKGATNPVHTYKGEYEEQGKDYEIAGLYCKMVVFQEELNKHGGFWKFVFFWRTNLYNDYINRAKEVFRRVGFDEEKDGPKALDYMKTTPYTPYAMDKDAVETDYDTSLVALKRKHTPQLRVARDHQAWAKELGIDPEFSIESQLGSYAEKYGVKTSHFLEKQVEWFSVARDYDTLRDTHLFEIATGRVFSNIFGKLVRAALKNGEAINVADIMKDAREITVLTTHFNTIGYSHNVLKDLNRPPYMKDVTPQFIKERLGNLLGSAKMPEEAKAKIIEEAVAKVNEWNLDPEKAKAEDEATASKYPHLEIKDPSPVEEKIIKSLLTIGYRPPEKSNSDMMKKHNEVIYKMRDRWFKEGNKYPDDVKSVFEKNVEKMTALNKIGYRDTEKENELRAQWDQDDDLTREKLENYNPITLDQLIEGGSVKEEDTSFKESVSVVLDNESSKAELSPKIVETAALSKQNVAKN